MRHSNGEIKHATNHRCDQTLAAANGEGIVHEYAAVPLATAAEMMDDVLKMLAEGYTDLVKLRPGDVRLAVLVDAGRRDHAGEHEADLHVAEHAVRPLPQHDAVQGVPHRLHLHTNETDLTPF